MNLAEKMSEWGILKSQLDALEQSIVDEVKVLGKTQSVGNVEAKYRKSSTNGSYNWEYIVGAIEPDMEIIEKYTVQPPPKTDWKKIADEVGVSDEIKNKFYTQAVSEPSVTVKLI